MRAYSKIFRLYIRYIKCVCVCVFDFCVRFITDSFYDAKMLGRYDSIVRVNDYMGSQVHQCSSFIQKGFFSIYFPSLYISPPSVEIVVFAQGPSSLAFKLTSYMQLWLGDLFDEKQTGIFFYLQPLRHSPTSHLFDHPEPRPRRLAYPPETTSVVCLVLMELLMAFNSSVSIIRLTFSY